MNRQFVLLGAVLLLLVGNVAYRIWANWGLITVAATGAPLSEVIRSIEKQSGVKITTNLEPEKKITMHVKRVPLSYAMEVLAGLADARWELGYFFAPEKATIESALGTLASGEKLDGWKRFFIPLPGGSLLPEEGTSDPRRDRWEVRPAGDATLQAYLEQASKNVSARIEAPQEWNPPVSSPPKSGEVDDVMPRLAKAAGGQVREVFLLTGARQRPAGEEPRPSSDGPPRGPAFVGAPPGGANEAQRQAEMEERVQAEINKLSGEDRKKAEAEYAERKKWWEGMKDLPADQRRAKMEERMQDPAVQEKMFSGMAKQDALKTPEQRINRYRDYLQRKQNVQN